MRPARAYGLALIAAGSLGSAGCEVGPNFSAPPSPSERSYVAPPARAPTEATATGPPPQTFAQGERVSADWWTLFHSPQLDALVKQAAAGNQSLQAASARMTQAQEAFTAAMSARSPQLSVSANDAEEKLTAASFGLPPGALALPQHFNLLQVGPTARYSLDLFGGTRRRIEQAQGLADAQAAEVRVGYLTLTGNTVLRALELATLRAQRNALEEITALDRRNLEMLQTAMRLGSIAENDAESAKTQLAQDQALLPPLEQSVASTTHALAVLLGRAPDDWQAPAIDFDALTLPASVPVSLPSQLVRQRPDIIAVEAQLHAASAQIGVATAALYPDISLTAFVTGASLNGGSLFNPASLAWSVAAGLTQPIFDGHLRRSERREALAAYRAAAADYQQTVLNAFEQVADLLDALDHDAQRLAAEKQAVDSAWRSAQLQEAAYLKGASGILGLLDAQRQYQQASMQYVRAQGQRYEDTAQLLVAMGGGWWSPQQEDRQPLRSR